MERPTSYDHIARDLEKQVFLTDAEEGNNGLYSLIWELGVYTALTIGQKYTLASDLLKELVMDGLLVIEEYEDTEPEHRWRTIKPEELEDVLNDPTSWYPGKEPVLATAITTAGKALMDARDERAIKQLVSRLMAGRL
jgi:hypothetical protein